MTVSPSERLFRKAALDRLSSPEELDRVVALTSPRGWLALAALLALLAVAVVWSVVGTIPTRVTGSGLLVGSGGRVFDAVATASGTLVMPGVKPGDTVAAGQLLARIDKAELEQTLEHARAVLAEREGDLARRSAQLDREALARQANFAARRVALKQVVAAAEARVEFLATLLRGQEDIASRGFTTRQRVEETRQELAAARQKVSDAKSQLLQIDTEELDMASRAEQARADGGDRVADARRRVDELVLQIEQDTRILSPTDGRVTEWKVADGARVAAGMPVVSIESGARGLQLVLYVPPEHGKALKPGMDVRIAPSTARKEEYGTLIGRVAEVSDFPSTPQGMQAVLQNDRLVQQFSAKGPPFAVRVDLLPDATAPSGYRWSSGAGPAMAITSGTLAEGEVTVREQPPLAFVIPALRKVTGL
ncbi:NHLP bacteriocin system secretion protein [Azospirillum picis]|uniref:HlyD family secretion protein n=1 Tax=Azospirillum picis TaxID=488438 RepID=A0ABU0MDW6_9PROT|nr:NHLP bacteriocin system secretion protein [Azospirillum picis]MBP2297350.1 HlyD family secretion protein [Azospirillum picis]MDQ0531627.1 HlyD family secretion protein [Azospirillum picis]